MPRRKKSRRKSTAGEVPINDGGYDALGRPTKALYESWPGRAQVTITRAGFNEDETTFKLDDIVYIAPDKRDKPTFSGDPDDEESLWIGRIIEIRDSLEDGSEIWMKIAWYYKRAEFIDLVVSQFPGVKELRSFKDMCGENELVFSDHEDLVSAGTCDGHVEVIPFDETDLQQRRISSSSYFCRSHCNFDENLYPRSYHSPDPSCTCHEPYNPSVSEIMRLCPRPQCRTWYHESCLVQSRWLCRDVDRGEYKEVLEMTSECYPEDEGLEAPLNGIHEDMEDTVFEQRPAMSLGGASSGPVKKRVRFDSSRPTNGQSPKKIRRTASNTTLHYRNTTLVPRALSYLAQSPIVRGGKVGVVGNVKEVVEARRIIRFARAHQWESIDDRDWKPVIGEEIVAHAETKLEKMLKKGKEDPFMMLTCPKCRGII